jgi:hypothetical protein
VKVIPKGALNDQKRAYTYSKPLRSFARLERMRGKWSDRESGGCCVDGGKKEKWE